MAIATFSGLASGIQWQDLISQIMAAEEKRLLGPAQSRVTAQQGRLEAWNSFQTAVTKFRSAALKLQNGTAFDAVKVTGGTSSATGRSLFSASASSASAAGNYRVEVVQLAKAEKLSGDVLGSATTALGAGAAGSFLLNGVKIDVAATDTLNSLRDKINAANTGTSPTRVTATILSTGSDSHRLVLTSEVTGSGGIELLNANPGGSDPLAALGLTSGTLEQNRTADGLTQSVRLTSSSASLTTLLGISPPPANTSVLVGGQRIEIDFSRDSLSSVMQKVNAAGGHAAIRQESVGGTTVYRLAVSGDVTADSAATFGGSPSTTADSQRAVEALGFQIGSRVAVAQSVTTGNYLVDAATGTRLTASQDLSTVSLSSLRTTDAAGTTAGSGAWATGETLSIRGTRADGTSVSLSFDSTASVQSVLDTLNDPVTGFGGASTAAIQDGRIVVKDRVGGASQLSLSFSTSGGALAFGTSETVHGRAREVVSGADARLRVDGVLFSRATNTVSDAISGVTLNLLEAEAGSAVDLSISRDSGSILESVKSLAAEYNALRQFVEKSTGSGGPLAFSGSLRAAMSGITKTLVSEVVGTTGSFDRAALVGVSLDRYGRLQVDETKFKEVLASNPNDVRTLFATAGTSTNPELEYILAGSDAAAKDYAVEITALATKASFTTSGTLAGAGGTYAGAHSLSIKDSLSGKTVQIADLDGKSIAEIAAELNVLFGNENLRLSASEVGGQLRIEHGDYGSANGFTASGTFDTAQLDFTADVAVSGTDVQGTIDGVAATGSGQTLTSKTAEGETVLSVRYTGTTLGAVGDVKYTLGIGGMFTRATEYITRSRDGLVVAQTEAITTSVESLSRRVEDIQARLELRRAALVRQFSAMETAMSRFQSQGTWLTSQIAVLPSWSSSK